MKLTFRIVWTFLNVWTKPISFSCYFFHICKLVNEIIRNLKWFVNNCFTDGHLTDWNFEQWLPFTNPLRPVYFNKHHFSIFSHFNRSSATVLNKAMSMQIHMLYKINCFFTKNVSCIFKTEPVLAFTFIPQYFIIFVLCIYIFFINMILYSEAVLCGSSY